ncbi:MAG TPA: HAMP domain-containing sensor histidine kinase [Coleofasciculaceae cyanobacterium]
MNSIAVPDEGLFAIAAASLPSRFTSCLSPATVQSFLSNWVDLLLLTHRSQASAEPLPVIVWAKFPKTYAWEQAVAPLAAVDDLLVYRFSPEQDGLYTFDLTEFEDDETTRLPDLGLHRPSTSISLPFDSPLTKEYFFLVWSAAFQGGVVARRAVSVSEIDLDFDPFDDDDDWINSGDQDQSLQVIFSLEPAVIQQLLQSIEQVMTQAASPLMSSDNRTPWQSSMAKVPGLTPALGSLHFLLSAQLQKQEELWQQNQQQSQALELVKTGRHDRSTLPLLEKTFLSHLGQELRTPLSSIKTALSLINAPTLKPAQRQRYMDLIAKECDRQNTLVTSLMNLIDLDQEIQSMQKLQPVQLQEVIPTVVNSYQPLAAEKGIRLTYTLSDQLPPVTSQTHWLQQIMIHLLNNGMQFTPRGGQVWVRARQEADQIHLEVRDSGLGISQGEIAKIFNPFYRTRQADEESIGVGMGLPIVEQLVRQSGGSISVKSRVGEGSTFHVLLPIYI